MQAEAPEGGARADGRNAVQISNRIERQIQCSQLGAAQQGMHACDLIVLQVEVLKMRQPWETGQCWQPAQEAEAIRCAEVYSSEEVILVIA